MKKKESLVAQKLDYVQMKQIYDGLLDKEKRIENWIEFAIFVFSFLSLLLSIFPTLISKQTCSFVIQRIVGIFFLALFVAVFIIWLFRKKWKITKSLKVPTYQYYAERKKNQILNFVFQSLHDANSGKIRKALRITYGSVPEWNPMNYELNWLVYDVHDQIRSILINLKKVIINIAPDRFSDKNVSVDLVWCYPEDMEDSDLPLKPKNESGEKTAKKQNGKWKLISSGDLSGNRTRILDYLAEPVSFYTLLACFGSWFANNKYADLLTESEKNVFRSYLCKRGIRLDDDSLNKINSGKMFIENVKDFENTIIKGKTGEYDGSVAGSMICVRNDNPEHVLVKAILTINTYGERIHIPISSEGVQKSKRLGTIKTRKQVEAKTEDNIYDENGLTECDYQELFLKQIIQTYSTLIASELSQMYIRHILREKRIDSSTGMEIRHRIKLC